jgi:hypothetical protein
MYYYEAEGIGGLTPDGLPANEPSPDGGVINGLGQWGNGGSFYNFTFEPNSTSVDPVRSWTRNPNH